VRSKHTEHTGSRFIYGVDHSSQKSGKGGEDAERVGIGERTLCRGDGEAGAES